MPEGERATRRFRTAARSGDMFGYVTVPNNERCGDGKDLYYCAQKIQPCTSLGEGVDMLWSFRRLVKSNKYAESLARPLYQRARNLSLVRAARRRKLAGSYYHDQISHMRSWARLWTEEDNFYYSLTPNNREDLASLLASIIGTNPGQIRVYIDELLADVSLRNHITSYWSTDETMRDATLGYGRREGWYALVRALKPRLVVETGVHHGVGACVLTSALLRNAEEGYRGIYVGTDIDPSAGALMSGPYAEVGSIHYGDSLETLRNLAGPIDLFINDSDHSASYEAREYRAVAGKLAPRSLILGDNSHATGSLRDFARETGRPFLFFREQPKDHWYPGAGIGLCPSLIPYFDPDPYESSVSQN